jgi:hypothetical protein
MPATLGCCLEQRFPRGDIMMGRRMLLIVFGLALMAVTALAADVAGRWSITITTSEGTINGLGSLKQTGDEVTGWVGPSEDQPIPVNGKFREGKLILKTLPQAGRTVAFDEVVLTIDRDTMSGTIEHGSHGKGTIKFVRSK